MLVFVYGGPHAQMVNYACRLHPPAQHSTAGEPRNRIHSGSGCKHGRVVVVVLRCTIARNGATWCPAMQRVVLWLQLA